LAVAFVRGWLELRGGLIEITHPEQIESWNDRPRVRFIALLAIVGPGMAGCTTNPATGESSFTGLMSESDEVRIGRESHAEVLAQFGGVYEDPELNRYIDSLGQLLARASDRPNLQYHFTVLDSPVVNAFATPGGYVYMTRGLLALANSEAEVAGVLAHEIGHVAARHAAERQSQAVLRCREFSPASSPAYSPRRSTHAAPICRAIRATRIPGRPAGRAPLTRTNYDPGHTAPQQLQSNDTLDATIMGRPEMADQFSIMRPIRAPPIVSSAPSRRGRWHQVANRSSSATSSSRRSTACATATSRAWLIRDRQFLH
jgi:hypothetical protein